jgi:hypothetical protein
MITCPTVPRSRGMDLNPCSMGMRKGRGGSDAEVTTLPAGNRPSEPKKTS